MITTFRLPIKADSYRGYGLNLLEAPQNPGAQSALPAEGKSDDAASTDWWIVVLSFVGIALVWWLAAFVLSDDDYPKTDAAPVQGLTIFAVFFVAAQAIERLLEPISMWLTPDTTAALAAASDTAVDAHKDAAVAEVRTLAANAPDPAADAEAERAKEALQAALDQAAGKAAAHARWRDNRKALFWALATGVSLVAAASLNLYLLRATGIAEAPRVLDLLATALIIGSGTKPLHSLVELVSAKAAAAKEAAPASA